MTRLDDVEEAYARASGTWSSADWHHERRDAYGVIYDGADPVYCDGTTAMVCATCAAAAASAHAAEAAAAKALAAARDGDWEGAVEAAQAAWGRERAWGGAPTWGPFTTAIEDAAEAAGVAIDEDDLNAIVAAAVVATGVVDEDDDEDDLDDDLDDDDDDDDDDDEEVVL